MPKKPKETSALAQCNDKERRVAEEYASCLHWVKAVIRAGLCDEKQQYRWNVATAYRRNPKVQAAIKELLVTTGERVGLTREAVLERLRKLVFVDVRKIIGENGECLPLEEIDDDTAAAIASVKVTEFDGVKKTEYKFIQVDGPIYAAMKHLGIQGTEKTEGTLHVQGEVQIVKIPDNGR